jgi:hypothetical protein
MSDDGEEFDAAAAAARATGEARTSVDDGAENQAAAEGAAPPDDVDVGGESTLREMMLNTEPDVPLSHVEDPWDPEEGGTARIYRAVMKAADIEGLPAVVDAVIGVVEAVVQVRQHLPDDEPADADQDAGEAGGTPGGEEVSGV